MKKQRPEFSLCLAPQSAYWRHDRKRLSRHISYRSTSLEKIIAHLNKVNERRTSPRFPWKFAFIYKSYPGDYSKDSETVLSIRFKD